MNNAAAAAELKPDSYQARGLMGDIFAAAGDKEMAAVQYAAAASMAPKYAAFYKSRLDALNPPAKPARKRR